MVLPVIQHRLTKLSHKNRRRFVRWALGFSAMACTADVISVSSNSWIYTSEVLKYYVFPNGSEVIGGQEEGAPATFFKNATIGPWQFCWLDPITEFHCNDLDLFKIEDPFDLTTSVELSVRYAYVFMALGCVLDIFGLLGVVVCCTRKNGYETLFISTVTHIIAALTNYMCLFVFMAALFEEVGNNVYPASEMEDPLFRYTYGHSLILLKLSFMLTECAAIFLVVVFMSKRDERMFNRYQISTLLKSVREENSNVLARQIDGADIEFLDAAQLNERYHQHARINRLRKASWNPSLDESIQGIFGGASRVSPLPNGLMPLSGGERVHSSLSVGGGRKIFRYAAHATAAFHSQNTSDASDWSVNSNASRPAPPKPTHPITVNIFGASQFVQPPQPLIARGPI